MVRLLDGAGIEAEGVVFQTSDENGAKLQQPTLEPGCGAGLGPQLHQHRWQDAFGEGASAGAGAVFGKADAAGALEAADAACLEGFCLPGAFPGIHKHAAQGGDLPAGKLGLVVEAQRRLEAGIAQLVHAQGPEEGILADFGQQIRPAGNDAGLGAAEELVA